jgi:hypothetical protein
MHKQRIYIDTSIIGSCFDKVFVEWSNRLFMSLSQEIKLLKFQTQNYKKLLFTFKTEYLIYFFRNSLTQGGVRK